MRRLFIYLKTKLGFKPKSFLHDGKYRIIPAFEHKGIVYYMHQDPLDILTGRGLQAMSVYEELMMRCSLDYLQLYHEAMTKLLSNSKQININEIAKLNYQLGERINFSTAIPNHIYKLASIVFFDNSESPAKYDPKYNQQKIKSWMEDISIDDFFFKTPLKTLIPFLQFPQKDSQSYFQIVEKINEYHKNSLSKILNKKIETTDF